MTAEEARRIAEAEGLTAEDVAWLLLAALYDDPDRLRSLCRREKRRRDLAAETARARNASFLGRRS